MIAFWEGDDYSQIARLISFVVSGQLEDFNNFTILDG